MGRVVPIRKVEAPAAHVVLIGKVLHRHAAPRTRYLPPQPDLWADWDFTVERRERDAKERQAALEMRKAS